MPKGGKTKDIRLCIYCTRPIYPKDMYFTVTNMLSQIVGRIHSYCYPYKQTEYANRGYGVVTNLGVVLLVPKS